MADPISWIAAKAAEWVAMTAFQAATATGVSITTAATIANVAYAATYALVYVGAAVGLSSLVSPKVPNAEQGKVPVNQTTPRRRLGTGRARLSGPRALWESLPGWNVEIINVLDQPVDAFEQFWLNDDAVTVDAEGWVQRLNGAYGDHEIRILTKTGQAGDDGAFEELVAMFAAAGLSDLYDESHVGEGVARMALLCKAIDDRYVMGVYPNGPPALSATVRLCRVYDWRDPDQDLMDPATWKWSANAHVNHVHWEWCLRHLPRIGRDGVGWIQGKGEGSASPPPPICLEDWYGDHAPRLAERTAVADLCNERVPLAAGGDEARYEQHGWWEIGTEDADVRAQYLICYDGWMAEGGDGALIIKGGRYEPPPSGVVLSDRNLVEASWNRGAPDKDVYNIIKATFTSRAHGYSPQPADDWRDEGLIAEVGDEKPLPVDLGWVQSHGQARRLMKRMAPRVFADRHGDLAADLDGLNHIRRRYGRLERKRGPTSMRSVDFELLGASIDLRGGRVPLNIVKADPNVDAWNPVTEEGVGPSTTDRAPPVRVPLPVVISAEPVRLALGGANGVRIRILIEDLGRPGLTYAVRWRGSGGASWVEESPQDGQGVSGGLAIESGLVDAGPLEYGVSAWSAGFSSGWTDAQPIDTTRQEDPADFALQAYLDATTVQPSPARSSLYRNLISELIDAGVWSKLDALYLLAAHDGQAALVNMKTPSQVLTAVGGPAFLGSRGYQGNGSSSYLQSGFDASAGGHQYVQDSAHMGVWNLTEVQEAAPCIGMDNARILPRNTSDNTVLRANNASSLTRAGRTTSTGHTMWSRVSATAVRDFRNGVLGAQSTSASAALPTGQSFRVLGAASAATASFSGRRLAAAHWGGGLTDVEASALHAALNDYLAAVGAA
ncbi:hypothetical protein EGY25_04310 [Brevundimonas intermedia]|uniref:Tip attachment protein J domain-containing protein n=1 Tax=Brevundimonas intermedia TaxID=74315 RepID=A0A4Y9RZG9_9CAUL|nr:hypothetical protein [Brevundimonas intermedia]TFW14422.1 hypothetical protein EGY25_04310 [Brevundimonas intermedia]